MKIAVISDSHDHIWNTRRVVEQANRLGVEVMIHCGDLVSPFMLEEFDRFQGRVHLILGNNPGDQVLLMRSILSRQGRAEFHGWFGAIELGGISIAWIHSPDEARHIARSGDFSLVCCGHTHRWSMEDMGHALLLNPGEILGRKEQPGWALIDVVTAEGKSEEAIKMGGPMDGAGPGKKPVWSDFFGVERIFLEEEVLIL